MTTNGMNTSGDVEMEHDGEKVVTMMDVLQEQQDFEEDANAVLGASDDKNCTYSKGYVKRQAIYACLTCCPDAVSDPMKRAGVCLACSLACHENHELVELYTKRNFRCDCGNPKFPQPCQFTPNKTELNYENKYNQNFSGIYCNCKRPYPDPESSEEEEMIQCIVCEDWLHINHLEATVPSSDQYAEMICKACMEDIDFLQDYSELVVNVEDKEIIVMDPDLDVSNIIKANKSKKEKELTNGVEKAQENNDKEMDSNLLDNIDSIVNEDKNENDSIVNEDKNENTADADMSIEPEKCEDDTDASKEETNVEQKDPQTETEVNSDTNESNNDAETDNQTENVNPETGKESGENVTDQTTETEKVVNDQTSEPEKPDNRSEENKESIETSTDKPKDPESTEAEKTDANLETDTSADTTTVNESPEGDKSQENCSIATADSETESQTNKNEHKRRLSDEGEEVSPKKQKLDSKPCVRPRGVKRVYKGATFWPSTLRHKLCTCTECLAMYKDLAVLFLTDPEDTVTAYEALGKEIIDGASSSQYEKGLQALSSLDRVQQINALTEYNKMRDRLLDFLKSFKDRKEIVKEEDIKAFFAGMKPKREPDGVYFCR